MLGTLKQLFTKEKEESSLATEVYTPDPLENPNFLTNPIKIRQLLKELEEDSLLCVINIENASRNFNSSILDVQVDSNQLIIDELIPKQGNEFLLKSNKLKLSTIHDGIHLAFNLKNAKPGMSQGIAYYKFDIPDRVYYPQRRSTPRIQMTSLNIPFSGTLEKNNVPLGGKIYDLSRGGVGILGTNIRARIKRGDLIRNCQISLNDESITFDLVARFIRTSGQTTQVGGYFENLVSKERNKIEHFVASIEREEIRRRKA